MSQSARTRRAGGLTINSNWIMTTGIGLLFAFCIFLLISDVRDVLFRGVDHQIRVYSLIGVVYYFIFAYSFPSKVLKIAFLLLGIELSVRFMLGYFAASPNAQHAAALAGSFARQIALVIILFEMGRWFKSVIKRTNSSETEAGTS